MCAPKLTPPSPTCSITPSTISMPISVLTISTAPTLSVAVRASSSVLALLSHSHVLPPIAHTLTTQLHHGKHHRAYVDTLNKLVASKPMDSMPQTTHSLTFNESFITCGTAIMPVEDIIMQSWNGRNPTPEFNQAAQVSERCVCSVFS